MKFSISENLKKLSSACQDAGGKLFIVGGYVRNVLLSLPAYDIDLSSPFTTEEIIEIVQKLGWNYKIINKKLGTVKIITGSESYEHTTFRKDTYADNGSHTPDHIEFVDDIKSDALRRDFTANAIYYDIQNDKIIDFFGGVNDIKKRQLAVINNEVFKADGLRLLRLIRFAVTLNFKVERKTLLSAYENRHQLKDISKERVIDELKKTTYFLNEKNTKRFLQLLNKLQCLKYIVPTLTNLQLKSKHFKFHDIKEKYRYTAFCMIILASFFNYKINTNHQIMFACHRIFGNDGFRKSNKQLADLFSIYVILQHCFVSTANFSLELICDYYNASEFIKNFLAETSPKLTTLLNSEVEKLENKNIPLSENALDITSIELLTKANIENRYISKIKQALFTLCLNGKIENEKSALIQTAKHLNKSINGN